MSYRPKLILQIDCDSEYVMEKHYGVYKKQRYEYYSSLKLFTEKFKNANLKSTLFVVGKDIENKNVQQYIFMQYKNTTIDGERVTEKNFFQEIYYAAFFRLIYIWVFSKGERKSCLEFFIRSLDYNVKDFGHLILI